MRRAAAMADHRPPSATTAPAATPQTMKATVTAFGDQPRRAKTQVARGDTRRMYRRPAQCSSLSRSRTAGGWPVALSSASDGPDILLHSRPRLRLGQTEVFQDGVAAGAGAGGAHDRLGELRRRQAQVGGATREAVPREAGRYQAGLAGVLPQVGTEQRAHARQLPMRAGPRVEL